MFQGQGKISLRVTKCKVSTSLLREDITGVWYIFFIKNTAAIIIIIVSFYVDLCQEHKVILI